MSGRILQEGAMTLRASAPTWYRPVLAAAGLVFALRAAIGLFSPDYWSPQSPLDYAAAASTSLAFVCLAVGLWGFSQSQPVRPTPSHPEAPFFGAEGSHPRRQQRIASIWRLAVAIACISAAAIGVSNFLEDVLGLKGLGAVWVGGILVLLAGLLAAGASAFWVQGLPRWVGGLLLACAVGLLFIGSWGFWVMGLALLALAVLDGIFINRNLST
jgi:hypothetical protein